MDLRSRRTEFELFWRDGDRIAILASMLRLANERLGLSPERLMYAAFELNVDAELPSARSVRRFMFQHKGLRRAEHYSGLLTLVSRLVAHEKSPIASYPDGERYRSLIHEHAALVLAEDKWGVPAALVADPYLKPKEGPAPLQLWAQGEADAVIFLCFHPAARADQVVKTLLKVFPPGSAPEPANPTFSYYACRALSHDHRLTRGLVYGRNGLVYLVGTDVQDDEMTVITLEVEGSASVRRGLVLGRDGTDRAACARLLALKAQDTGRELASIGELGAEQAFTEIQRLCEGKMDMATIVESLGDPPPGAGGIGRGLLRMLPGD